METGVGVGGDGSEEIDYPRQMARRWSDNCLLKGDRGPQKFTEIDENKHEKNSDMQIQ